MSGTQNETRAARVIGSLTLDEIETIEKALEALFCREYRECLGPRGGYKETPTMKKCQSLRARLGFIGDD